MQAGLKTAKGFSLIELMLVLAIIVVILLSALRYYQVTELTSQINTTISDVHTIGAACQSWWEDNNHNFGGLISISMLADDGYISSSYATNAWGGLVSLDPTNDGMMRISLDNVPPKACNNLYLKFGITDTTNCGTGNKPVKFLICVDNAQNYVSCNSSY